MNTRVNSFNFKDKYHCTELFSAMDEQRQQRHLCDVILKVADKAFYAHRNVLAATSLYFRAMFTNDMAESQMKEITMKEIEPSVLDSLINFAYRGELHIDDENVRSLMIGASLLLLESVRNACAEFLISQLNPADALETRKFANSLDCTHLDAAANEYIQQNFSKVMKSEEFLELNIEDLLEIIENDYLKVDSEETTYEASMRWIKANEEERVPLIPRVLAKIRLHLLSPQFLVERVSKEDLIRLSLTCRDLVDEAIHFHLFDERRVHFKSSRARHIDEKIIAVGGIDSYHDCSRNIEIYDPFTKTWQMGVGMATERCKHGVAVSQGKLYVFGGNNVWGTLLTVEVFDPNFNKWSQAPIMKSRRRTAGVAALNNFIYVCGGHDGRESDLDSTERFCLTTETWRTVAPMKQPRCGIAAAALEGCIYAAGGWHDLSYLDSVEKYDPAENSWVLVRSMIQERYMFGLCSLNEKLYACGGRNSNGFLKSTEVYIPAKNVWLPLSPMNCKRSGLALVGSMGKLWAIGGWDGVTELSSVEVYDPVTDKWSFAASMKVPRRNVAAAVIGIQQSDRSISF